MAKNNSKSIRLSDKTLEYIENYRGNGFNEKFENIILDAKESESKRLIEVKRLDEAIASKKKECEELSKLYYDCKVKYSSLVRLIGDMERLLKK